MRLPQLPYAAQKRQGQILSFRGLNLTDNYQVGNVADCLNITTDRYPYVSTRNGRDLIDGSKSVAITNWNKLIRVSNDGKVYYGDDECEGEPLTASPKQFAVVNTKLIIWPDKVYLDMSGSQTPSVKPLAISKTVNNTIITFETNKITIPSNSSTLLSGIAAGNIIHIAPESGVFNHMENARDYKIISATYDSAGSLWTLIFDTEYTKGGTQPGEATPGTELVPTVISRDIPDMDYICSANNRLWGCNSERQMIYASALGDPGTFFDFSGVDTDSYQVAVPSDGVFTGCIAFGSSVLFWKEEMLHKMLGSYPSQYMMYNYNMDGVKDGCHKSMVVSNETLYYVSLKGVYTYSGGGTSYLSSALGNTELSDAVAGTDGEKYYLSARTGDEWNMYVYSSKTGMWVKEDKSRVADFTRIGDTLYKLDAIVGESGGEIYSIGNGQPIDSDEEWMIQYTPFIESISGAYKSSSSVFANKRYGKLIIRAEIPQDSYAIVYTRFDGGRWEECSKLVGETRGLKTVAVPIRRADKFELKLCGKGQFALLNLQRDYIIGSEK